MKKNNYMNIVKAFGIIAMVVGHSNYSSKQIIYQYHMALFFFTSGYFYNNSNSKTPIKYIIKKIKTNYLVYVKYCLLFLLLRDIFFKTYIYSTNDFNQNSILYSIKEIITLNYNEGLLGTFWFIVTLFFVSILYNIISYICYKVLPKRAEELKLVFLIMLFSYGFLTLKYNINLYEIIKPKHILLFRFIYKIISPKVVITLLIYHLGYFYRQHEEKISFKLSYCIACIILLFLNSRYGNIGIADNTFVNPAFFIVNSLLGIYINIYFAKLISDKYKNDILHFIGQNTLYIMTFHFLAFKIITMVIIITYKMPLTALSTFPVMYDIGKAWWLLYSLVGVFVPLIIPLIINCCKNIIFRRININR